MRPNIDHASCLAGFSSVATEEAQRSRSVSSAAVAGASGSGSIDESQLCEQLVEDPDAVTDRRPRLPARLVPIERKPLLRRACREPAAGADDRQRQTVDAGGLEARQGLDRLARVTGGDDQGPFPRPCRKAVVTMDDQGDPQPLAGGRGHELGADRRAAHRQDQDRIHLAEPWIRLHGLRHAPRLGELPRQLGDLVEHALGIDALQRLRVVERDGLLEQRRALALAADLVLRTPARFLVGVLVAEEVAGVHQPAATFGRSAPAIRRPSARRAWTSSGERAST
jgi:hypothetical protein